MQLKIGDGGGGEGRLVGVGDADHKGRDAERMLGISPPFSQKRKSKDKELK